MENMTDEQGNLLANIIRIASSIETIAIDGIDGYATPEQTKREIQKCLDELKDKLTSF